MYRIDSRGSTVDGRFTEGNPTTGTPATVVDASWMNAVQDEIVSVIAGAGIALDKTNNSQLIAAIQALATVQVRSLYPVGSVYVNATDSRNPALIFGFGTWASISGRAIFGFNSTDVEFNAAGKTGGSKTHSHSASTESAGSHSHSIPRDGWGEAPLNGPLPNPSVSGRLVIGSGQPENEETLESLTHASADGTTGSAGSHSHGVTIESSGNLPPYFTAFVWRRTA